MPNALGDLTIDEIRSLLRPVLQEHSVERATLFGSRARGDNRPDSDIDLHVLFTNDSALTLANVYDLETKASLVTGRAIDLVPIKDLQRTARLLCFEIQRDGIVIYERDAK